MTAELWRHKPVVKEAVEYTGSNAGEVITWAGLRAYHEGGRLLIVTPQGDLEPQVGDYIVRGIEGEFYPVPRSIFLGSYEPVGEGSS